jgi:hypothetical protein
LKFTEDQSRKYFESRLGNAFRKNGSSWMALCPFHEEKNPSCSFDFRKGTFYCHTEGFGGGMVDFEMKFNNVTAHDAAAAIGSVMGLSEYEYAYSGKAEATYEYRDEQNRLLFEVVRSRNPQTGKKRITNRRPIGKNSWEYTLDGTRRVLYRLNEVLRATEIFVCEGEKCVDAIRTAFQAKLGDEGACIVHGITATTNPHGAGKWREEFSVFFAGKKVVVIPDNDGPGRDHMQAVASSVSRYTVGVKWLELPLDNVKDDVADYLEDHSFDDLMALAAKAPYWYPKGDQGLIVPVSDFMKHVPDTVDWRVEGVIEKGTSGFMIASPKSGKSMLTIDLAVALALGQPWMECKVSEPTRVAIVSREDAPGLTARRLKRAILGRGAMGNPLLDKNLMVNTREQSKDLMLDNDEQLAGLIQALQAKNIEFCILDVLNVLHDADENDNSEMRRVLTRVSQIRKDVGCQMCIVHHSIKEWDDNKTLSQLARGSSAIAGFAEFIVGIRLVDEETRTRQMRFETKSADPINAFCWKIYDSPMDNGVSLIRVDDAVTQKKSKSRIASV